MSEALITGYRSIGQLDLRGLISVQRLIRTTERVGDSQRIKVHGAFSIPLALSEFFVHYKGVRQKIDYECNTQRCKIFLILSKHFHIAL